MRLQLRSAKPLAALHHHEERRRLVSWHPQRLAYSLVAQHIAVVIVLKHGAEAHAALLPRIRAAGHDVKHKHAHEQGAEKRL